MSTRPTFPRWARRAALGLLLTLTTLPARGQSTLVRLGDTTGGLISGVSTAALDPFHVVTVTHTPLVELKATVWVVGSSGTLISTGEVKDGTAADAAVAALSSNLFVSAARRADGSLGLTSWRFAGISTQVLAHAAAGPITDLAIAAVGPNRVVTATTGATGSLKLIVWKLDSNGIFTRKGEFSVGTVSSFSLTAAPDRRVVVAMRDSSGVLKVELYDISAGETLLQRGMRLGPAILDTQIVSTAYDRVVTASRLPTGELSVATWDLTAGGAVLTGTSASAGAISEYSLTAVGSTRVATAVRQGDGTLKLITWQVVEEVKRLDSETGGAFSTVSATTLGADRIVLALKLTSGSLKVIDFGEFSVGMIHRTTGFQLNFPSRESADPATVEPAADGTPHLARRAVSPAPTVVVEPDIAGVDPMVAAGKNFVIASQDHWLRFLDKAGNNLPSKWGEATLTSAGMFFQPLWTGLLVDGTVNRNNINLHLRFPLLDRADMTCNPMTNTPMTPCMDEVYDTRVYYDQYISRFIVVSAVRHQLWLGDEAADGTPFDPIVRRYVAVAVSRTDDPRDGFQQYMFTEANYQDYPRMGVANGFLVISHASAKSAGELNPIAYVVSTVDLANGVAEPRNFKIYPYSTDGGALIPVNHFGNSGGFAQMAKRIDGGIQLFNLPLNATAWDTPPTFFFSFAIPLDEQLRGLGEGVTFRNNALHFVGMSKLLDRVPNLLPPQWQVRVLRVPLLPTPDGMVPVDASASGYLDLKLGTLGPGDSAGDFVSCEMPALAVNSAGHMLISYGRTPVLTAQPLEQEVRYNVLYNDQRGLQSSRALRAGELVLKGKDVGETTNIPIGHNKAYTAQASFIDLSFAVVDPSDDSSFWFTNEFASSATSAYEMVVGKVIP